MSAVAVPGRPVALDRAAVARAVLARAEERTGTARRPWGDRGDVVRGPVRDHGVRSLPVDPTLDALLPSGLERGTTLTVAGSTSLLLAMLARASADGAWVAVVGLPAVGLLAAHQLGLSLERLVLVPDAGPDGPRVLAAMVDGVDAVVVGDVALTDVDRRKLSARARERSAVLLSTGPWPGASVVLTAQGSRWSGVGRGEGRLRTRVLTVAREGRGAAGRGWHGQVPLPGVGAARGARLLGLDGRRAG
ncbi:MAG: hypothetical protein KQH57_04630 [Actinomycetales bacterium]|nr:hypothetical protein [Actinomycetales bacterium]